MTREEAIKWQEVFKKTYGNFPPEATEACDMAIEALEKQIPKKPIYKHYEDEGESPYIKIACPNRCGIQLHPVTERHLACEHVYCPKCGQKIDWSGADMRKGEQE